MNNTALAGTGLQDCEPPTRIHFSFVMSAGVRELEQLNPSQIKAFFQGSALVVAFKKAVL